MAEYVPYYKKLLEEDKSPFNIDNGRIGYNEETNSFSYPYLTTSANNYLTGQIPTKSSKPRTSKFKTLFKDNNNARGLADTMGNLTASLASSIGNFKLAKMYKNMKYTSHYVPETPVKLKTTYNINPQLAATNRNTNRAIRAINENTSSSPTALNRIRENLINNSELKSQLYGTKENKETELLNDYMKHTQEVFNRNAKALSDDIKDRANFEFNKMVNERTARNEGINDLGKFANSSIHDWTNNARQRERDRNTMNSNIMALSANKQYLDYLLKNKLIDNDTYKSALANIPTQYNFQSIKG